MVFAPFSIIVVADQAELFFIADDAGDLRFFERRPGSWTEHLEKQAARERAKATPKPRLPWVEQ